MDKNVIENKPSVRSKSITTLILKECRYTRPKGNFSSTYSHEELKKMVKKYFQQSVTGTGTLT